MFGFSNANPFAPRFFKSELSVQEFKSNATEQFSVKYILLMSLDLLIKVPKNPLNSRRVK